jgi:pimeloyl-ACP methyl ester carboxylesterase
MTEPCYAADKPPHPPVHRLWVEAISAVTPTPRRAAIAVSRAAPKGDGHPVLVVPAFLRGDRYMLSLRRFIGECGYAVAAWGLGLNVGPTEAILAGIERRLDDLAAQHQRKVSLVGHSLGGAIARELAKKRPDAVRQLTTLASPIRLPTASPMEGVYRLLSRWHSPSSRGLYAALNEPASVPTTAIYTRTDGIVAWQSCLEAEGPMRESIEVAGPHSTMARNPAAWRIVADRLAQPEGRWQPYAGAQSSAS